MDTKNISDLQNMARRIRVNAVKMTSRGNSSHIASVLSIVDILTVLYARAMHVEPKNPKSPMRDRFILSKGHAGAGVYATLAELDFFPEDWLEGHYQNGSIMSGHVSHKGIPGVEFSTGSLGHGLPVACGMALAAKRNGKRHNIFCLMSDGELGEGSNWEAFLFANHHKLSNLTAIVDRNRLQSIKDTEDTLKLEPLRDKFQAFGWEVLSCDGHDFSDLERVLSREVSDKPKMVIANTVKGKGVSFMENKVEWHYKSPQGEFLEKALMELQVSDA
jgi:transketolase